MSSPRLQAAALSMLPACAQQQPALVLSKMELITTLANSSWWEVHAQLVVVAATLLEYLDSSEVSQPIALLHKLLDNPGQRRNDVLKVAACSLAPCIAEEDGAPTHTSSEIISLYSSVLLALPVDAVKGLMDVRSNPCLSVPASSTVVPLALTSPPLLWSASQIAQAMIGLDELTPQACAVLLVVGTQLESAEQTGTVLQSAHALYSALGDASLCVEASTVLQTLMQNADVASVSASVETVVKACGSAIGDETCRTECVTLLTQVAAMHDGSVATDLGALLREAPELMEIPEVAGLVI
eukprot:TRINITY_DN2501_c0_g1_i3.p1 TRINITY_DN2501_c0_g1~~TRINITY_DN2501_c0_g1_i3.p1  ORF type:complete len:298 (+),score=72.31 TRINITY_DN2501_c0_g1_i3:208-1101(+)